MKKYFKLFIILTVLFSCNISAIAALGSVSKEGSVVSWEADNIDKNIYELVWNEVDVENVERIPLEHRNPMGEVNDGNLSIKDHLKNVGLDKQLPEHTKSIILIQEIRDLICRNIETKEQVNAKNVTVTWEVPSLVEGNGEVWIYHYSDTLNKYELIEPINVDYVNKTVTAFFTDLSPIGVLSLKVAKEPVGANAFNYPLLLAIISVVAGTLYVLTGKKK